jgi:hypothetical protein
MCSKPPLSFQSHSWWRVLPLKALELISWYQYLFKFVSELLLTFTSNTIVEGYENPQRNLSERLLCFGVTVIYIL